MNVDLRRHFGLERDPWRGLDSATADAGRVADAVREAVAGLSLCTITGPPGSGKTRAVRAALAGVNPRVVQPLRLDRENLHLGDVQTAVVRDLSGEAPKRSGEARSGQVMRLLGTCDEPVLLVIDDAHCLHHQTIRGLRRLHELAWRKRSPLLGIVLVGQRDPAERVPEVRLRADRLELGGLTRAEASSALRDALGRELLPGRTATAMAASPRARTWLGLIALADDCLAAAMALGDKAVTDDAVASVLGKPGESAEPPNDDAVGNLLADKAAARERAA